MKLKGKVALVTGSSSGIGKALALGFAAEGADVVVNYHKNIQGAKDTAKRIASLGRRFLIVKADVGKKSEVDALFCLAKKEFKGIDILVNNAGLTLKVPFEKTTEEEWDRVLDTNLKGVFLCSVAALPLLKNRRGCILNISSLHAVRTIANFSGYAASKGGVEALTRSMALELGEFGVRVNGLRIGWIQVERDYVAPGSSGYRKASERIPLGRAGEVEDVVPAAIFLCSEDAGYISGQVLGIDGGHEVVLNTAFPKGFLKKGAITS